MARQRDLFDSGAATEARDEAVARVSRGADADWLAAVDAAARACAMSMDEFTTDDVWRRMPDDVDTNERRAMGPAMKSMEKAGVAVPMDKWILSARVACHRRPLRVWGSLLR